MIKRTLWTEYIIPCGVCIPAQRGQVLHAWKMLPAILCFSTSNAVFCYFCPFVQNRGELNLILTFKDLGVSTFKLPHFGWLSFELKFAHPVHTINSTKVLYYQLKYKILNYCTGWTISEISCCISPTFCSTTP